MANLSLGPQEALVVILLGSPGIILAVHMVLSRMLRTRSRQMVAALAVVWATLPVGILLGILAFPFASTSETLTAAAYCVLVYFALGYTYFHFFNTSETARRIKLLFEIYRVGSMPANRIADLYKTADIINLRLNRLIEMNQLGIEDGYYVIRGRSLAYAALLMSAWQRLLGLKKRSNKS